MNSPQKPTVVLMMKAPRPGLVKTRLAQDLGNDNACALYRWMVERQLSVIPSGWCVEVHLDPPDSESEIQGWLGKRFTYWPQVQGDLGMRMSMAAEHAFSRSPFAVVLIGADCPGLSEDDLEDAARRLESGNDAVFGPAVDGGYYLLGIRALHRGLFEGVSWSSPVTLKQSLAKAAELGLRVSLLPEKEDVDTIEGYERAVEQRLIPSKWET